MQFFKLNRNLKIFTEHTCTPLLVQNRRVLFTWKLCRTKITIITV